MHAYMHAYIHPYIHTSIHPSIHTYIHTYIHVYTYTSGSANPSISDTELRVSGTSPDSGAINSRRNKRTRGMEQVKVPGGTVSGLSAGFDKTMVFNG